MKPVFRKVHKSELADLEHFFNTYWRRDHVFFTNPKVLDWQHRDDDTYCFILARDGESAEIIGMCGFIPTRLYDPSLTQENVVWFTNWCVGRNSRFGGLGLAIQQSVESVEYAKCYGTIGLKEYTLPLYTVRGFEIGTVGHYVCSRNEGHEQSYRSCDYSIARIEENSSFSYRSVEVACEACTPKKSSRYIFSKYHNHPVYTYEFYAIARQGCLQGILVFRIDKTTTLPRIYLVDFVGRRDIFFKLEYFFQSLLHQKECYQIDLFNYGLDEQSLLTSGFVKQNDSKQVKTNVSLHFAVKPPQSNLLLFMGDADLDRPN
jgi:hypothetical protein